MAREKAEQILNEVAEKLTKETTELIKVLNIKGGADNTGICILQASCNISSAILAVGMAMAQSMPEKE